MIHSNLYLGQCILKSKHILVLTTHSSQFCWHMLGGCGVRAPPSSLVLGGSNGVINITVRLPTFRKLGGGGKSSSSKNSFGGMGGGRSVSHHFQAD